MNQQWKGAARRRIGTGRDVFIMSVIAGLVSSAYAQTAPAQDPAQPQSEVPSTNSATSKDKAAATVNVTGYRSSLALSAMEKRDNVGLTDTVFSEDMGKFPDPNIADALARVPGVQVTRGSIDGEGMNISIRGMGSAFTRVLLNGAPMASASAGSWGGNISANREVDMDFLPSELFRRATVYKSQQASVIEGGIAGTVDMRSVRPFDKSGFRSAFTLSGNYRDRDGRWGNTGSALVSNTWNTRFGKVGLLGGFAFGNTRFHTDAFQTVDMRNFQLNSAQATAADNPNSTGGGSQSTPAVVPSGLALNLLPEYARSILVPGKTIDRAMLLALNPGATIQQIDNGLMGRLGRHLVYDGERNRKGEVLSFQWQPNDKWDVYLDTLFAQKGSNMTWQGMNVGTRALTPIPIGMEFDRSDCSAGCVITKATLANTFWGLEFRPIKENTHFRSINPGFEWRPTDKLTIDGHVNFTSSSFYRDSPSVLVATQAANSVITYDNTVAGQAPTFTGNLDPNDPNNFGWYQGAQTLSGVRMELFERTNTTRGTRLNLNWGDSDFSIKAGGSYDDIARRYRTYSAADAWANVVCGNNMNVRFFTPNTQLRSPGCDGRSTPGLMTDVATAYPGYGTGSTAGMTTPLAYLGSAVPNSAVPSYLRPTNYGFVTLDWAKFAADTDYQYFRDNIYNSFTNASGGYIREKVGGVYTEVNGRYQLFGHTLRYNAGVRYTRTEQTIGDLSVGADPRNATLGNGGRYDNIPVWAYETTKYSNTLPSMSLAYNITSKLIARVSGSKSMTRPNPADLRQTRLSINDAGARAATVTNPDLKPFKAQNLDVGLEYYMSRDSYVAVAAFNKKITSRPGTLIQTLSLAQLDELYGTNAGLVGLTDAQQLAVTASGGRDKHLVQVSSPYNIDTPLKVRGLELTWQQALDMLPVKGFGFTSNFTFSNQKDEAPGATPVAGVPPRTNNLTIYYERNGLNARVSRQYQGTTIVNASTGLTVPGGAYAYSKARQQVDMSVGVNLKQMMKFSYDADLTLSVWNLSNSISQTYTQFSNAIYDESRPGRSYTLSLRTKF
jgi:TonB-dependent receptor